MSMHWAELCWRRQQSWPKKRSGYHPDIVKTRHDIALTPPNHQWIASFIAENRRNIT